MATPLGLVLDRVPAAADLAARIGMRPNPLPDAEEGRECLTRVQQRRCGVTSGLRPSSIVIDTSPRSAPLPCPAGR
jgi:hypothetical protein